MSQMRRRGANGAKGALIAKTLLGVRPSIKDPELCNKCEDKK